MLPYTSKPIIKYKAIKWGVKQERIIQNKSENLITFTENQEVSLWYKYEANYSPVPSPIQMAPHLNPRDSQCYIMKHGP